jgi:small-conductance mechanosensitive channel
VDAIVQAFRDELATLGQLTPRILVSLLLFLFAILMGRAIGSAVERVLHRTGRAARYESLTRRLVAWAIALFGLVLALELLGLTTLATSLLATGGFAAVIFGFAFKEIGENLLASEGFTFSSEVTTGLSMPPLDVRLQGSPSLDSEA